MQLNFRIKKAILLLFLTFLISCSNDDDVRYENPYLADINVALQINLALPEFSNLQFPGNKYVTYNYGLNGIVVYCLNPSTYTAFELTDPNHVPQNCSRLTVTGIKAACDCDENEYEIISGQSTNGQMEFPLKPYRVEKVGNVLQITNY